MEYLAVGGEIWSGMGTGAAWVVTISLMVAGLVGCVLPILPGHLIIFLGALAHRLILGKEESGLAWWSFVVLGLMLIASQIFDFVSGSAGSKWFGGTKWGALGAFAGSIAGLFFLPFGLLLGPLIGAFAAEMLVAKKKPDFAASSGLGSVVGTLAGMVVKVVVGLLMVIWFFVDVYVIQ